MVREGALLAAPASRLTCAKKGGLQFPSSADKRGLYALPTSFAELDARRGKKGGGIVTGRFFVAQGQ
jgi:hypothetical protein